MTTSKTTITKLLILTIAFTLALSVNYIFAAWTGPQGPPPTLNTPTPVHVGLTTQTKDGGLIVGGLRSLIDLYVDGNIGIGTTIPTQKLDVMGGIKMGDTTSCIDGTMRYSGSDFEGCKSGSWVSFTAIGSGTGGTTQSDCNGAGGSWEAGQSICYFTGTSCPAGWIDTGFNSTQTNSCAYQGFYCNPPAPPPHSCIAPGHTRKNSAPASCQYNDQEHLTSDICVDIPSICTAILIEIGCVLQ